MRKLRVRICVCGAAMIATTAVWAGPLQVENPVTMAMGGIGVAIPNPSSGAISNPAQLSVTGEDEDFAFGLSMGLRARDPDETIDTIDDAGGTIDEIDALADQIEGGATTNENFDQLADLVRDLNGDLQEADENLVQIGGGTSLLISRPSETLGVALTSRLAVYADARLNYTTNDSDRLEDLAQAAENNDPTLEFDENDLTSEAEAMGVAIVSVGLTLSHRFEIAGQDVAVGVTPKHMQIDTILYVEGIDSVDTGEADDDQYRSEYTDTNFDLGVLTTFDSGLSAGLTIRNVIAKEYDTAEVNGRVETVTLDPQARVGIAYDGGWYDLGADLDLNAVHPTSFADGTRYLGVGGEVDAWGWAQIRAGYRVNLEDSEHNVVSAGIGFSPFDVVHLDLGVAGNDTEMAAALSLFIAL